MSPRPVSAAGVVTVTVGGWIVGTDTKLSCEPADGELCGSGGGGGTLYSVPTVKLVLIPRRRSPALSKAVTVTRSPAANARPGT